jgi:aminopeptidase N
VRYRHRGERRSAARKTLGIARAAVEQFSAWYGDPGETEIDLVPSPFPGGMEYPGLVLTSDIPRVITHELAHQWWYALVGNNQWRSPWLDESFAEFSARRLPTALSGRDGPRCKHDHPVKGPLTASMGHWESARGNYFNTVYFGGACALRSLEMDIGAEAMTTFLRSYADAHRFGIVTRGDFVAALRAAAPAGYDVDAFLRRARIAR